MSFNELAGIVTCRPHSRWPGARTPEGDRETSRFTATWSDTVALLVRELSALEAAQVVLELDVTETQLRRDGLVRSDAQIADPGVVLSFESVHGPLRYACDRFAGTPWRNKMRPWQHNVRAIALGLEALRKVDRYGITQRGEQYAGWKALPAPMAMDGPSHMTFGDAADLLVTLADLGDLAPVDWQRDPALLKQVIRRARAAVHPDRHGGDKTAWDEVAAAVAVVDR